MANSFALDTLRQAILSQKIRESHGPSPRRSSNAAPSVSSDDVQFGSFVSILACPRHVRLGQDNLGNAGCPVLPVATMIAAAQRFQLGATQDATCILRGIQLFVL